MTDRSPLTWYHPRGSACFWGAVVFLLATGAAASIDFGVLPPLGLEDGMFADRLSFAAKIAGGVLRNKTVDLLHDIDLPFIAPLVDKQRGFDWLTWLAQWNSEASFYGRLITDAAAGLAFAVPIALWAWLRTPLRQGTRWVRGPRLITGLNAPRLARAALGIRKGNHRRDNAIYLAPGVPLPREREIRSFLILGAQRSGKTVFLRSLLRQLLTTPAKLVVYDIKGDMTATWPDDRFILLAPHDARSWAWDIGRDVIGEVAGQFASALVPEGKEAIWAQGAQIILTALIIALQERHGTAWGWRELNDVLQLPPADMQSLASQHYAVAGRFLSVEDTGEFTRNAASYVNTLLGPVAQLVRPLAEAWGDIHADYRVSLTSWLADSNRQHRVLILQGMPQFAEISRIWITFAISHMVAVTGGSNFPDSSERRIWFVLDEFAQLGKIPNLFRLPATHAAKGVYIALALQSFGQASETYGPEAKELLTSMTGTKLIFRLEMGESAEYVAHTLIGRWDFEVPERVVQADVGMKPSRQIKWRESTGYLVLPAELGGLGPTADGVEGLVLGLGDVYRLFWPYEKWPEQRTANVPARWITRAKRQAS